MNEGTPASIELMGEFNMWPQSGGVVGWSLTFPWENLEGERADCSDGGAGWATAAWDLASTFLSCSGLKVSENFPCEKVQGLELPWVSRRVKRLNEKLSNEKLEVDSEFPGIAENSLEDHTE